jgi:UDP-glucose 4-epimerase
MNKIATDTSPVILVQGATGRLGNVLRRQWAPDAAVWCGRRVEGLTGIEVAICLAGGGHHGAQANIEAPRALLAQAAQAGVARVILMSSQAVYGRGDAGWSEDSAGAPISEYGRLKQQMEGLIAPPGVELSVLRVGNVAGSDALLGGLDPRVTPVLDTFADGRTPRRSYIGPATFARVLAHLARYPGPLPARLNLAAPGSVEMADLLRAAGRDWQTRAASATALPEVVMQTDTIEGIYPFLPVESTAAELVRQWHEDRRR